MKTTVDIPKHELDELIAHTKAGTKKEAILAAIREYNDRRNRMKLANILGTFEGIMRPEELEAMRESK